MKNLFLYLLLSFTSCLSLLSAQEHHLRHFTTEDGLPTNSVYGCIQDKAGYIWAFTEKGIAKFDGYTFKNYTVADGLPTNDVWDLTEDHLGRIWIQGYANEAAYIWKDSIFTIPIEGAGLLQVNSTTDGRVALFTGNPLFFYLFDGKELVKKTCINLLDKRNELNKNAAIQLGVSDSRITRAFIPTAKDTLGKIDCQGNILGKYAVDFDLTSTDFSLQRSRVFYTRLPHRDYWINAEGIIQIIENGEIITLNTLKFSDLKFMRGNSATQYWLEDSTLQLSVDQGLLITDAQLNVKDFYETTYLSQKGISLNRKIKDKEGNIWIATESRGLYLLTTQARTVQTYIPNNNAKVTTITAHQHAFYYGTEDGAVYQLQDHKIYPLIPSQAASNPVLKLAAFNQQLLIVVRDRGTEILNLQTGERKEFLDYLQFDATQRKKLRRQNMTLSAVKDFAYNEAQKQFIFGHFSGLYTFTKNDNNRYVAKKWNKQRTIGVAIKSNEGIWTAHDDGLGYIATEGQQATLDTIDGLKKKVFSLLAKDNKVWVGTDGEGVFMYAGKQLFPLPDTQSDIVDDLYLSADNILWVATNKGLKEIQLSGDGKKSTLKRIYEVKDGLPGEEIHCVVANEKEILIGTNFGLTVIPRNTPPANTVKKGSLRLNQVTVNGDLTAIHQLDKLTANQNEIIFDFVNLSFNSIGHIQYSFFLEGADTDWQTTKNTSIRYPSLAPGSYIFHLKSRDLSNEEISLSAPVQIVIAPPWWQTNWFYLCASLIGAGLAYGSFNFLVNSAKRKNAKQFQIEKKFGELELQALQAQMNPHFIFNCLNGIQSFILDQEVTKAVEYMGKFGQLMRLFLEASKNKFIPLDEEITLLRLYTELEQMRFSNAFQVQFEITSKLDTEAIQIPSLLIQPFVENAILHGLMKMDNLNDKKLIIRFFENETQELICEIVDNGIGRAEAALLKTKPVNHKSRATQIVNERLEVLRQMGNLNINITMEDVSPTKKYTGTLIRILIPV